MSKAWAALAYLPVPFWALVPALAVPGSRLVRFHAWQGGTWTVLLVVVLAVLGPLSRTTAGGFVAGLVLVAGVVGLVAGAGWAARGRFGRLRPAWDLVVLVKGRRERIPPIAASGPPQARRPDVRR